MDQPTLAQQTQQALDDFLSGLPDEQQKTVAATGTGNLRHR
jgi:hypothetical protein